MVILGINTFAKIYCNYFSSCNPHKPEKFWYYIFKNALLEGIYKQLVQIRSQEVPRAIALGITLNDIEFIFSLQTEN